MTLLDYGVITAVCLLAGAAISDFAKALMGYVAAMTLGMIMLFTIVMIPITGNPLTTIDIVFQQLWIGNILFSAFPFPFIGFLIASVIGSYMTERYF